jgi:hypothetical protein
MGKKLVDILGGNVGDSVAKIISLFKLSPEVAANNAMELQKIQADLVNKQLDAANAEMDAAKQVIIAEAQSQSWLPRIVRPLLLLLWGSVITFNAIVPIVARFWIPGLQPFPLDPWVYKLTAIGFTGYVTARTWEKANDKDQ